MSKQMKIVIGVIVFAVIAAALLFFNPFSASAAVTWDATQMVTDAGGKTGGNFTPKTISADSLSTWVQGLTTWALGIAIVIFVLKVVLTAIDQMIFAKEDGTEGFLTKIPLIGAYSFSGGGSSSRSGNSSSGGGKITCWKDVFIHFGKNVGIVAGAWIIVQIVTGIILFVFSSLSSSDVSV